MKIITNPAGRSPYEARLNNKRKGTRSHTRIVYPWQLPNRSVGETEAPFNFAHPLTHFKFSFNKGKHFKPAGGSMRNKSKRRSRTSNYARLNKHFGVHFIDAVNKAIGAARHPFHSLDIPPRADLSLAPLDDLVTKNRAKFIFDEPVEPNREVVDYLAGRISWREALYISAQREMKRPAWDISIDEPALTAMMNNQMSEADYVKIRARKENGLTNEECLAMIGEAQKLTKVSIAHYLTTGHSTE